MGSRGMTQVSEILAIQGIPKKYFGVLLIVTKFLLFGKRELRCIKTPTSKIQRLETWRNGIGGMQYMRKGWSDGKIFPRSLVFQIKRH